MRLKTETAPTGASWSALVGAAMGALLLTSPMVVAAGPLQPTGEELWVDRHDPDEGNAFGFKALVSPDGTTVYAIGMRTIGDDDYLYRVAALESATGEEQWVAERPGTTHAATISPDGEHIYIAGTVRTDDVTREDWTIRALDSAAGAELWSTSYLQRGRRDAPSDIEVTPDNERLYVTGQSLRKRRESRDFTTLALDAGTSDKVWARRYDFEGGYDEAIDPAVAPRGNRVFVTGFVNTRARGSDYATLAYDAATGNTST